MAAMRAMGRRIASAGDTLGHAFRSFRRSPGLFAMVVAVFALGIGANAAMLETLDRLLLRPPPHVHEAEAVQRLYVDHFVAFTGERVQSDRTTHGDFADFREMQTLEAVAAWDRRDVTIGHGPDARQIPALLASGDYWRAIGGASPALGRFFDRLDDRAGAAPVAVVGHRLWQTRFGGSEAVIGETIDFGHGPYTIIGVAPPGLTTLDLEAVDLILPFEQAARHLMGDGWVDNRNWFFMRIVGRLAPGASAAMMEAEATALHRAGRAELAAEGRYDPEASIIAGPVNAGRGPLAPGEARVSLWLTGVALVVLLISAVNVANLLLARSIRMRREVAVRMALGISRRRLIGQQVMEGALVGMAGAVAAIAVDRLAGTALRRTLLPNVAWEELAPPTDLWILLTALAIVAGVLAVLPTALRASRQDISPTLQGAGAGGSGRAWRARSALCVAQASLSVLLLVGAGLFLRSVHEVRSLDLGFDLEGLHEVRLVTEPGAVDAAERGALVSAGAERLRRIPGVTGASATTGNPFRNAMAVGLQIPGVDSIPRAPTGGPYVSAVGEDYLRTLGTPILEGRGLEPADHATASRVAVVGATMARRVWDEGSPIGSCLQIGGSDAPCWTVVGVAADPRRSTLVDEAETFQYWIPAESAEMAFLAPSAITVRLSRPALLEALRAELLGVDPRIRFVEAVSIREALSPQLRSWRLGASLFTVFGVLALVVAALGLYSVMAFDVVQRTREIGIRSALGATRRRLLSAVMTRALWVVTVGIAFGLALAVILAPRLQEMLYGVNARDPVTFGGVAAVLLLVALLAAYLPARRAARVDPMIALRAE